MKILAIGAHPDDVEICAFGTLARCVERGDSVVVCAVTNGNLGHHSIGKEQLRAVRLSEAAKSAAVIKASFCTLDIDDMALDSREGATRLKMLNLVRSVQPDLIITHSEEDYHSDHVETARLVFWALQNAPLVQVEGESPPLNKAVTLYEMDMIGGGVFNPLEFVDITQTIEAKLEALSNHMSQLDYLMESAHIDLLNSVRVLAEFRGLQCRRRYAEGFRLSQRQVALSERLLP
ncbi:MAG: PIG-L deacetylase family protein [Sphaerochaetaceae bacterium]